MKKRLFSVLLTVALLFQCAALVSATAWTDRIDDVNVDMELKQSATPTFVNGPVVSTNETETADFKVTLEMSAVKAKFQQWQTTATDVVNNVIDGYYASDDPLRETARATLMGELNNMQVTGRFEVIIEYPNTLTVPAESLADSQDMYGFNVEAKETFYEISRVHDTTGPNTNKIIITIGIRKNGNTPGNNYILAGELISGINTRFADITFTVSDVQIPSYGTYTAKGFLTGYTDVGGTIGTSLSGVTGLPKQPSLHVTYTGKQKAGEAYVNTELPSNISATIKLQSNAYTGGSSVPLLSFVVDGKSGLFASIQKKIVKLTDLPAPKRDGYVFNGWYYDKAMTQKVTEDITLTKNTTLYGSWSSALLDSDEHFAYIIGYPDGTVKPQNNITREEVATIFYRLLRAEARAEAMTDQNDFSDVSADRWSNKAISTLAKGAFIKGYEDGTFAPSNYITRAEFVTMATAFAGASAEATTTFTDISGHWAEEYIKEATSLGWIEGYADGTFAPGNYITRAEAMTIINRMLSRKVDAAGLHADTKLWSDLSVDDWYYYIVLEATNSHDYTRGEDAITEIWSSINENKIWTELDEMENPNK